MIKKSVDVGTLRGVPTNNTIHIPREPARNGGTKEKTISIIKLLSPSTSATQAKHRLEPPSLLVRRRSGVSRYPLRDRDGHRDGLGHRNTGGARSRRGTAQVARRLATADEVGLVVLAAALAGAEELDDAALLLARVADADEEGVFEGLRGRGGGGAVGVGRSAVALAEFLSLVACGEIPCVSAWVSSGIVS